MTVVQKNRGVCDVKKNPRRNRGYALFCSAGRDFLTLLLRVFFFVVFFLCIGACCRLTAAGIILFFVSTFRTGTLGCVLMFCRTLLAAVTAAAGKDQKQCSHNKSGCQMFHTLFSSFFVFRSAFCLLHFQYKALKDVIQTGIPEKSEYLSQKKTGRKF